VSDHFADGSDKECSNCGGAEVFVLEDDTGNAAGLECRDCGEVRSLSAESDHGGKA